MSPGLDTAQVRTRAVSNPPNVPPDDVIDRLADWPVGHVQGTFAGHRYGASLHRSADGRRVRVYAEALGDTDHVSFNLFRLTDGRTLLKPCEMPVDKVVDFVRRFVPDPSET